MDMMTRKKSADLRKPLSEPEDEERLWGDDTSPSSSTPTLEQLLEEFRTVASVTDIEDFANRLPKDQREAFRKAVTELQRSESGRLPN